MNIQVNRIFLKELAKIPVKQRKKVEKILFREVEHLQNIYQIPNIGKLKGYSNYYKIRFGDYRVGLRFEDNILYFERILHRKDIYKFYP